jgi:hypothetical protein
MIEMEAKTDSNNELVKTVPVCYWLKKVGKL